MSDESASYEAGLDDGFAHGIAETHSEYAKGVAAGHAQALREIRDRGDVIVSRELLADVLDQARSAGRTSMQYHRLMANLEGRDA